MKSKQLRDEARKVLSDSLKLGSDQQKADLAIKILSLPPHAADDIEETK